MRREDKISLPSPLASRRCYLILLRSRAQRKVARATRDTTSMEVYLKERSELPLLQRHT